MTKEKVESEEKRREVLCSAEEAEEAEEVLGEIDDDFFFNSLSL